MIPKVKTKLLKAKLVSAATPVKHTTLCSWLFRKREGNANGQRGALNIQRHSPDSNCKLNGTLKKEKCFKKNPKIHKTPQILQVSHQPSWITLHILRQSFSHAFKSSQWWETHVKDSRVRHWNFSFKLFLRPFNSLSAWFSCTFGAQTTTSPCKVTVAIQESLPPALCHFSLHQGAGKTKGTKCIRAPFCKHRSDYTR